MDELADSGGVLHDQAALADREQPELFSRMFRRKPWWEPVPAGLGLAPRAQLVTVPPATSRFFPVHPGWRHWRPPPGAVH